MPKATTHARGSRTSRRWTSAPGADPAVVTSTHLTRASGANLVLSFDWMTGSALIRSKSPFIATQVSSVA